MRSERQHCRQANHDQALCVRLTLIDSEERNRSERLGVGEVAPRREFACFAALDP